MKGYFAAALGALSSLVAAAPAPAAGVTDADILNYALTLEHLEDTFYKQGLKNFTKEQFAAAGFGGNFYKNLKEVSYDETTHVQFLTKGLQAAGAKPVDACTYSFPVTDPKTFVATAAILEGVGVSAYLGAAADIMNKTYLTDAGAILTVESRHSAYLRDANKEAPFPSPFDTPLDFNEVYTLASAFIVACPPSNPKLPVKAFPALTLDTGSAPKPVKTGSHITLDTKGVKIDDKCPAGLYAAFVTITGPIFVPVKNDGGTQFELDVPAGVAGQSYVVLNNGNKEVSDDTIVAGPAVVEVTPDFELPKY